MLVMVAVARLQFHLAHNVPSIPIMANYSSERKPYGTVILLELAMQTKALDTRILMFVYL